MTEIDTIPDVWYTVTTENGCSIFRADGEKLLKEIEPGQGFFRAVEKKVFCTDPDAILRPFNLAPRLKLALLQGVAGGWLPKGFTELEYLESSGKQCIDTPTVPQGDTRMYLYAEQVDAYEGVNTLLGCRNKIAGSDSDYHVFVTKSNPGKIGLYPYMVTPMQDLPAGQFTAALTGSAIEINGEFRRSYAPVKDAVETNAPVRIFAMNYNNETKSQYSIFKLYRFSLSSPTALLIDLIPALRKSDRTAGLYDKVSKQFFTNDGTGTFGYRIKGTNEVVKPIPSTYSLRAPRDPYYVPPSGVYARKVGENEPEVLADTEETTGEGWVWFANTAEAYEYFGIVQDNEELLTE